MALCQRHRAQMVRFFLDLHLYLARRFCENLFKVPGAQCNVNLARSITWLVSVTMYFTIIQQQFTSI